MAWTDTNIVTDRLLLRPFVDDDKPAIIEMRTDSDIGRYLGGPSGDEIVAQVNASTVGVQWGVFCSVDRATGEVVGSVSLDRHRGELEVSYELLPAHWGRGLATEAVTAVIGWAAEHTDDVTVIAVTQTANASSVALLERLGFQLERTFEEFDAEQGWFRRPVVLGNDARPAD